MADTRAADIEREGMLSDMETLRAQIRALRAEIARLQTLFRDISATRDTAVNMHLVDVAEVKRLQAALEVAKECIEGHFEDGCEECRKALAACEAALAGRQQEPTDIVLVRHHGDVGSDE